MKKLKLHVGLCAFSWALLTPIASAQLDVREGLLLEYPLDETEGGRARETISGRNTDTYDLDTNQQVFALDWANPGLRFRGEDRLQTQSWGRLDLREQFTWSARIQSDSWQNDSGIIHTTSMGMIIRDQKVALDMRPFGASGGTLSVGQGVFSSNTVLSLNEEHFVVITNDGTSTKFYLNGNLDGSIAHRLVADFSNALFIGLRRSPSGSTHYNGTIRDIRFYDRALTAAEVSFLQSPPEISDTMSGLWVGELALDEVKEVSTSEWGKAGAPYSTKVIFHSDPLGNLKLLQEATLMKTREAEPKEAVITQTNLVSNYDGIVPRGDKLIGMRFSSATFPMPSDQADFASTGNGEQISVTVTLPAAHPRNPFRHKYHPDLGLGRTLSRTITLDWVDGDLPNDGVRQATVTETITGLHKDPLEARGTAVFTRVSTSQLLNP